MIWKDRIKQYPHRYTLTNVSGTTYDFAEVTGEVNEVGTPVSAENMNKLLQRDGDDIKDTVTTFTEAGTRANIATGENTSTIFGKIKKWFTDLKPHAFANPSTTAPISSAAASNEKVYSEKLAFEEDAKKANSANPAFTGQILRRPEGDFNNSGLYGQSLIGTYLITHTVNTNITQFAEMNISGTSVRQAIDLKISNYYPADAIYDGQLMVTIDVFRQATSGNPEVNIKGTSVITPTDRFGAFYWTFDGSIIKFFYKAYTNYRYVTATVAGMSGWNLQANMFKFLSPLVDTGSTSAPATPSGGSAGQFLHTDYTQLAPTNNPTFTGTVTVPAPTNPTDAARLQDVTGLSAVYDIVIKTQAQFEALIADPTWFDAQSVAFVGQFTLSAPNGILIPDTVKQIHGFNNAKITITNFVYNYPIVKGCFGYTSRRLTNDYCIMNLEVDGQSLTTNSFAFKFCRNLINTKAKAISSSATATCIAYHDCDNIINYSAYAEASLVEGTYAHGLRGCTNVGRGEVTAIAFEAHEYTDCVNSGFNTEWTEASFNTTVFEPGTYEFYCKGPLFSFSAIMTKQKTPTLHSVVSPVFRESAETLGGRELCLLWENNNTISCVDAYDFIGITDYSLFYRKIN